MSNVHDDNLIQFEEEFSFTRVDKDSPPWKILIVDSDDEIHKITKMSLMDYTFKGRKLFFLDAFSEKDAKKLIRQNHDLALVLLDVNLETQNAGLNLIHYIRKELKSRILQIVIRTEISGLAPEQTLIEMYDVNDYWLKKEMSPQKLHIVVTASLRSFQIQSDLKEELRLRKKIEHSLRESRERFKDIALSTGDWVWETDARGRYTFIPDNIKSLTGYTASEFENINIFDLVTDESRKKIYKRIFNIMQSGEIFTNIEIIIRKKDGTRAYFLTSGKPVKDHTGKILGYRGVDKNITGIKTAEQEKEKLVLYLKEAQRLEALATLAGGIAHDFNNILGSILGYTQLLQMDVGENEKSQRYTEQIIKGCTRAKNLTLQILEFSRQRGDDARVKHPVLLSSMVKEKIKLLQASTPSSIKIKIKIQKDPGHIMVSPNQIHQILMNLCTNSLQAMENNQGTITVAVENLIVSEKNNTLPPGISLPYGEYVTLSVEDDGRGIEQHTLEKVFDPYFTTRTGGDGTGLGLSVVRGIVSRHKGDIYIKSATGKGTCITIYFPRKSFDENNKLDKEAEASGRDGHHISKGGGSILFVDDEPMLVDLGKMMLEKIGYQAVALESPREAYNLFKEQPDKFDMVVTDLTMPDIQGTALAKMIKELRPDIPVILVTGFSDISSSDHPSPSSIDAVLSKPLSMNALAMIVEKHIHKKH